jgi:hypothetical protein
VVARIRQEDIAWATRGDTNAESKTMKALLSELTESYEKEYVEVGVDKHLPFKKIGAVTAVAMAEQANINTTSMQIIARFLRRVLLKGQGREM